MSRKTFAVSTVLVALSLAACSSTSTNSSAGSSSGTPAGSTQSRGTVAASTTKAAPAAGSVSQFCSLIGESNKLMSDIAAGDDQPGGVDATKFKNDLEAALSAAPDEIKPDMKVIVTFDESLLASHGDVQETPALTTAMQHYATWIGAHCAGSSVQPGSTP